MSTITVDQGQRKISKDAAQRLVTLGILIIVAITLSIMDKRFLTSANMLNVMRQVAQVIITGAAATLLMVTGHMDLSVGSVVALTGVICAKMAAGGSSLGLSITTGIFCGLIMGALNGLMVTKLGITTVIATLGTMYVARGLAFITCGGKSISTGIPSGYGTLGRGFIGSLPISIAIVILICTIFYFMQTKTVLGRYAYAIGGNKTAATLSGINANRYIFAIYSLVGIMAGLSGVIMSSRLGSGDPNTATGFEFDVIVAIILGGTSLSGGSGSVIGTVIGALIVGFLNNGLNLMGVDTFYQSVFKGIILVLAVMLDNLMRKKLS